MKKILLLLSLSVLTSNYAFSLNGKIDCIGVASEIECKNAKVNYGQLFFFQLSELDNEFSKADNLILYINDIPMQYYACTGLNVAAKKIYFKIALNGIAPSTNRTIIELIREDFGSYTNTIKIRLGFGTLDGVHVLRFDKPTEFVFFNQFAAPMVGIFAIILFVIAFIVMTKEKALDESNTDSSKSLRKFQMLFWTLLIVFAYVSLWLILGDAPILPPSTIALLAISTGTGLISSFLPQTPKGQVSQVVVAGVSSSSVTAAKNGLKGLLVDQNDETSISRLQYFLFNIVFGMIFIYTALFELRIYDFSTQQLTLIGVSAAGYMGMKALKFN